MFGLKKMHCFMGVSSLVLMAFAGCKQLEYNAETEASTRLPVSKAWRLNPKDSAMFIQLVTTTVGQSGAQPNATDHSKPNGIFVNGVLTVKYISIRHLGRTSADFEVNGNFPAAVLKDTNAAKSLENIINTFKAAKEQEAKSNGGKPRFEWDNLNISATCTEKDGVCELSVFRAGGAVAL